MDNTDLTFSLTLEQRLEYNRLAALLGKSGNELFSYLLMSYQGYQNRIQLLESYEGLEPHPFAISDAFGDGIIIVDSDGIIIATNKKFHELADTEIEEVVNKPAQILIDNHIISNIGCLSSLKKKVRVDIMAELPRKNLRVLSSSTPYINTKTGNIEIISTLRDVTELNRLRQKVEHAEIVQRQFLDELNYLRSQNTQTSFIGSSSSTQRMLNLVHQVASVDATVLITGETGTGKEVVAKEIHRNSPRADQPYIKVNCAAIPEQLFESELFGYEKGAFTGALSHTKLGYFELANHGTLLLDEIAELPINIQPKLLRVLQERELYRIGGSKPVNLNIRVIAATNKNLLQLVNEGKFREDLYYRLNIVPISILPLRHRKEDIPFLAEHFLGLYNGKYNKNKFIDVSAYDLLHQYDWPGNVRELENMIERLMIVVKGDEIRREHIESLLGTKFERKAIGLNGQTLEEVLQTVEQEMLSEALRKTGSTRKAAKLMGLSQATFLRKAKNRGIQTAKPSST